MQFTKLGLAGFLLKFALLLSSINAQSTGPSSTVAEGCCQHRVVDSGNWVSAGTGLPGTYVLIREDTTPPLESCTDGCVYENTDVISEKLYCFGTAMKYMDPTEECDVVSSEQALLNSVSDALILEFVTKLSNEEVILLYTRLTDLANQVGISQRRRRGRGKREIVESDNADFLFRTIKTVIQEGNCTQRQVLDTELHKAFPHKPDDYVHTTCLEEDDHEVLARIKKTMKIRINQDKTTSSVATPAISTTMELQTTVGSTPDDEPTLEG